MHGDGVWLITGAQASGKSTVAELLARAVDRGVHVRGGQFYRWVVNGWVHPTEEHATPEARRLLDLRYRLSALVADEYAAAGFTPVVQDNIYGDDVIRWLDGVRARPRRLVVLRPSVDVVTARDARRQAATGKIAYGTGAFTPAGLDRLVAGTPRRGLWLDTSEQSPEETVEEIISREAESVLED